MPSWGSATDRGSQRTLVPEWRRWNRCVPKKLPSKCFLGSLVLGTFIIAAKQGFFRTYGIKDHLEAQRHVHLRDETLLAAEILNKSDNKSTEELRKEEPTKEEEKEEIEEDEEEKGNPLHDISRMDKHSVRLRWRDYPGECLIVWGNETGVGEFFWSIDNCAEAEDAWFRQRYSLPKPGEKGHIKSEIGKVTKGGHEEYCLAVPNCVIGTPLHFRPCTPLNQHNTFTVKRFSNGAIQIQTDSCPKGTCVDVPDQNRTTGNVAQVWACDSHSHKTASILQTDEVFSVGISKNDLKVFDEMELRIPGGPEHCQPARVSKTMGQGLQHFEVHCAVSPKGPLSVTFENEKTTEQELDTYATIWKLWCSGAECECKGHDAGSELMSISREERSLSCGVLMLSTHPKDGSCPKDLVKLQSRLLKDGKVDCIEGKKAAKELQLHPLTRHRLDLRYLQSIIVGLRPEDLQAFKAFEVRNSSDSACATKKVSDDGAAMEVFKMKCPSGKEGKSLGIEVVEAAGGEGNSSSGGNSSSPPPLTEGAVVWSLWCLDDECTCEPVRPGKEQFSGHIEQGQKGCGVMMLNTHSKFGACPKPLKHLQHVIEGDEEEVDCDAGQEEAEKMATDPEMAKLIKLKWVKMGRHESAVTKVTKDALSIFSVVGGAVVVGTVPAWPAVAKFSQFMVMMASNHAELGLPDEFNDFARKFTKFDELVKPLKKIKLPGLKDLGVNLNFVASSKWFLLKDKFVNQTMVAVLRVMQGSGMMTPGLVCFMEHYYDPVRRNLRDVKEVLEQNGGRDTCDYSAEEEAGVLPKSSSAESAKERRRRLEAVDETTLVAADGGLEAVGVREKWAAFQDGFSKQISFMQQSMSYSKKEFSVTKNLLFCLLVLPLVITVYVLVYTILSCLGSKWTYIPHLHPRFLLIFMADLILLNILMAWANVIWRRRLLQCENPFILLDGMLRDWNGMSAAEPVTSFFFGIVSCFRPIISLLALIPPLHVGLADSQRVAMIIFILGPCLIFLVWLLHFLCSSIMRHPVSNHFQDEECKYIKSQKPLAGKALAKALFYEQPQVAPVEKVIAMDADGKCMYDAGTLTEKAKDVSRCSLLASECKNFCCCCSCCQDKKKEQVAHEGTTMPLIKLPDSVAKKMSDANAEFDWVYRIKVHEADFRGLPEQVTIAFNSDSKLEMAHSEKPHVRLRIARGDQIVSVAFQARSMDHPFPKLHELEPGASKEEHHKAMEAALTIELLQSTWQRLLLEKFKEMLKKAQFEEMIDPGTKKYKPAELGYLKWTMWDHKAGWTVAAFNLELLRPMHIKDDAFLTLGEKVKDLIFQTVKSNGTHIFQQGWAEARMLKRPRTDAHEMCYRPKKEGFLWMKIAEDAVKGMLKAEEAANALPEVDMNTNIMLQEGGSKREKGENLDDEDDDEDEDDVAPDEDEEEGQEKDGEGGVAGGSLATKPPDQKEKEEKLGNIDDKTVVHEAKQTDSGFLENVSAATSYHDDHQQPVKEVDAIWYELDGRNLPALVLNSEKFKAIKRNDLVEILICGAKEKREEGEDGQPRQEEPLVKNGWGQVMQSASPDRKSDPKTPPADLGLPGIQLIYKKINPWEDPREPYAEVAVTRGVQNKKDEKWLEAIKRFPDSFVGKVEVPIKLQGEFRADLRVKVQARDMLRLKDEVPMIVPFDHLQLGERDRWRVFYLSDHLKKRGEAPQLMKIISALNIFFMVFAVVMIPKSIAEDPIKKAQEDDAWAAACPKDVADSEQCNPKQSEFMDMTEQIRRQINIAEGLSAAMIVLAGILILKVLINAYNDGDVKPRCTCCKSIYQAIKTEFVHLMRIFRREKCEAIVVKSMNFSKLTGDINTLEAFSRAIKKSVIDAAAEEVTLETFPGSDTAIVFAQVAKDFPRNKTIGPFTLGGEKKGRGSMIGAVMDEEAYSVQLKPVLAHDSGNQVDKFEYGGCKPPEEGDGVSRMLANHAGDKQAGWFNSLKEAAKSVKDLVKDKMNHTKYVTYAWEVQPAPSAAPAKFDDLISLGGHEGQLKRVLKEMGDGKEVKSVELTCDRVSVNVIFPDKYKVDTQAAEKFLRAEADLRLFNKAVNKVRTADHCEVVPNDVPAGGRCPSWFGPGFILGCLKLLLIVFLGLLTLANGGTFNQFLCAVGVGLFLWFLSRLVFDGMVEGAVFRSSTMEVGQVGLIVLPICAQMEFLEPITCSALMIIGVLWTLVTLCCKYLRDRIKKYEKEIGKFISKHTKTLKVYTSKYKKWSDCGWFWDMIEWLKRLRLKIWHSMRVAWHSFSANTRDPEWRWNVLFIILFIIACLGIAKLQHFALTELSNHLGDTGNADKKRAKFLEEAPGLALIFAVSLALLALAYMVFMKWLPLALERCRDQDQWEKHLKLADKSSKTMWDNAIEDEKLKEEITRDLVERGRAYGKQKPQRENGGTDGQGYSAMTASGGSRESILFDPLGIPVPMSFVPIFADDGGSILEGSSIMLQNGTVPFKRLLCTEWAWESPRYLVERTPLQVRLDTLARTGPGDVPAGSGDEPVPTAGVRIPTKRAAAEAADVEVLVATIQVVNFTGLTLGKTDKNDGILSLWRTPDAPPEDDLVKWFEQVRRFFSDYGASFEKGSRVYAVLENLFYGIKDYGKDEGPAPGEIVQEHKRGYMAENKGMPYKNWVDRSMVDLVRRLGPERPDFPDLEKEEVSDDEQQFLDKGGEPEKNTPSTTESAQAKAPEPAPQQKEAADAKKGGNLSILIEGCTGLPPNPPGLRSCTISVKTATVQNKLSPSVFAAVTPTWNHTEQFTDFVPDETLVDFVIKGSNEREVAKASDLKWTFPASGWDTKEIELTPDSSLEKQPACGCFGPGGSGGKPKLKVRIAYNPKDPSPPSTPRKEPRKRSPAALGFPGGPLAWKLLYPPVTPQLLHVVVTAEDLRPTPSFPKPVPFGAPPALGMQGLEPPIRETRTLGREPDRAQDPEEDDRPGAKARVPKAKTSEAVDMKQATQKLSAAEQASVREILARKQIILDENRGTIKFSQKVAIDFAPRVLNKDTPDAVYKNENKAKAGLKDAAELLSVYKTAKVVVEGHTNTKPKEMGDWSNSLAKNRAEKVVTTLVELGVEGERLAAVGKPGKSGTNKQEIVLQVRSI